ncbi:MATE family efflux transporter [Candidatus Rariloculus sp.]|uniref:MATE family efflux transporter n=1 Tax=Candidatus Rariloculus sp. TaxID=3101265 RepID=UPI003D0AC36C
MPMVIGLVALNSYSIADTYFVGQLGTLPLAAMGFTFPVSFSLVAIGLGVGIGTSSVLARLLGSGDLKSVQRITTHALILGAFLGLILMVAGLSSIDPVFTALGADELTLPLIREYMEVYYFGGFLLILPMVGNFAMRAAGDARVPALILTISALINIVLDPLLIFGLLGFPRWELQGAAAATVVANGVTVFASVAILYWRERLIRARYLSFDKLFDSWRRVLHVALPAIASNLLSPATVGVITSFVAVFGPAAVAGFGVASRIEALVLIVIFAVTSSVGPFTGQNFGAGRLDRVHRLAWLSESFCVVYALGAAAILWLVARPLVGLFDSNPDVIATASLYLAIVPFSLGGFGVMLVAVAAFNALGRPLRATALTFVKLFLAYLPLAWVLSRFAGLNGIFWANAAAHIAFGVVGLVLLRRLLRALADDGQGEGARGQGEGGATANPGTVA